MASPIVQEKITLGAICSSGGSALLTAYDLFQANSTCQLDLILLTDRACAAEAGARERGLTHRRLSGKDNRSRSAEAYEVFQEQQASLVLLYYLRLVTPELYTQLPTLNLHPSLLPAYPGFQAIERARQDGARYLGATLHLADDRVDGGPILAQSSLPIPADTELTQWHRLSFAQKVYLSLLVFELISDRKLRFVKEQTKDFRAELSEDLPATHTFNPALSRPELEAAYRNFLLEAKLSLQPTETTFKS